MKIPISLYCVLFRNNIDLYYKSPIDSETGAVSEFLPVTMQLIYHHKILIMKKYLLFVSCLTGFITINSCSKENSNPQVITQPTPRPEVTITTSPMNIFLPNNCARAFVITNSGPQGSTLGYAIYDNGALGGFLNFTNGIGSLPSGSSATISVTVNPLFVSSQPTLVGSTLVLDVSTPQATNYTHFPVGINIRSMADQAQNLLGTWSGTWSGKSYGASNPGQPSPDTSVGGTWTVNAQTVNPANNTASGTVTWNGTDAYWTYTFDNYGNITSASPQTFNATRTFSFNSSNATFITPLPGGGCDRFRLIINDFTSSTYGVYGPRLVLDMDLRANTVTTSGSSFTAWPYAPVYVNNLSSNQSNGSLSGRKL